ncbi:glycosyltransferase [Guyparkeria halopsychrophila]|uniref:glycosyltransferase n=1 Tax=Guyparkeria halopsychrophila TaxID=3139421 RepID=UPI0037C84980
MRIAQVMFSKGFGGAERYFVDLCLSLAARGHEVLAITHPESASRRHLEGQPGIRVMALRVRGNHDWLKLWPLARAIRAFRPDIVEAQLSRAGLYLGRIKHWLAAPLVTHVHNYLDLKYFRQVDFFTAATEDQARHLRELGVADDRVTVVPNFSMFPARERPAGEATTVVQLLAFGRFVHKKGFDVLLRAVAHLPDQDAYRLVLAGDGPDRDKLTALARELGIAERVAFPGWLEDVAPLLDQADVFVLPSRHEPFGIVVLEAMARGTAIVSTRTEGPVTMLDETTGWLCEIDNADDMAKQLEDAIRDDAGRTARAQQAMVRYRERYCVDAVLPQMEAGYRQALALVGRQGCETASKR